MQLALSVLGYWAAGLVAGSAATPEKHDSSAQDPRMAIKRALPYLARQTDTWITENKCNSCHQVPHALWAMNAARAGGFDVDEKLPEWNRWAVEFAFRETDKPDGNAERARERADEIYQLLLAGSADDLEAPTKSATGSESARAKLLSLLELGRNADGRWPAGGRLPGQIRPEQETNEVTTMWSLHTLRSQGRNGRPRKEAATWPTPKLDAKSTSLEHLVMCYMVAVEDRDSDKEMALRKKILSHQKSDGGWGWLLDGPSDAMATGQALYALSYMKPEHSREAVARAHQFLTRSQQPDGSWLVPSTLKGEDAKPYVVSNDWGTAWALIGLTRTLEE